MCDYIDCCYIILRRELVSIIAFGLAQAVSVAAGCMMELLLLVRKFWDIEISSSNIYANLPVFILVLIPGIILCLTPIRLCFIVGFSNLSYALVIFLACAIIEFGAAATLTTLLIKN